MNESHRPDPEDSDERMLEELLSHVKRVEPSLETRVGNRTAVAAELCRRANANRNRPVPWWRRTVAVPWPIALCAAALLLAVSALELRSPHAADPSTGDAVSSAQPAARGTVSRNEHPEVAMHVPEIFPEFESYQTETYLCGIGPLSSVSKSFLREE